MGGRNHRFFFFLFHFGLIIANLIISNIKVVRYVLGAFGIPSLVIQLEGKEKRSQAINISSRLIIGLSPKVTAVDKINLRTI